MGDEPRIHVLPRGVVNRIAAGEIIERPASIVKELTENSLDAGASRVEIEVREGGRTFVRVSDDGQGMGPGDLALAFTPHATSKLADVGDLLHIGSLGFRGEALASIGSVSRARIVSRSPGTLSGHVVEDEFGTISEVRPAAAPEGTTVEVFDLFRNVPARRKFLKSPAAEMARITGAVHRFGIAAPSVEFRLLRAGREVTSHPAGMTRRERIARSYGRELRERLIEARGEAEGVLLEAWLAPPDLSYADGSRMLIFLNGRHVTDRTVLHAIRLAYEDLVFGRRSPMAFVFLTMDPGTVDQNVHPAKSMVRFRKPQVVHSLVHRTLRDALLGSGGAHPVPLPPGAEAPPTDAGRKVREAVEDYLSRHGAEKPGGGGAGSLFPGGRPGAGRRQAGGAIGRAVDFLQVRNTFIVLETKEGILLIDQHALHERVLYDRLRSRFGAGERGSQRLLRPVVVELSEEETELLLSRGKELREMGVVLSRFGPRRVAIQGIPAVADEADPAVVLESVLSRLKEGDPARPEDLAEGVLSTLACRSAVKAGDPLSREEVAELLTAAERLEHAHTCPHGRPTQIEISFADLERYFRRR